MEHTDGLQQQQPQQHTPGFAVFCQRKGCERWDACRGDAARKRQHLPSAAENPVCNWSNTATHANADHYSQEDDCWFFTGGKIGAPIEKLQPRLREKFPFLVWTCGNCEECVQGQRLACYNKRVFSNSLILDERRVTRVICVCGQIYDGTKFYKEHLALRHDPEPYRAQYDPLAMQLQYFADPLGLGVEQLDILHQRDVDGSKCSYLRLLEIRETHPDWNRPIDISTVCCLGFLPCASPDTVIQTVEQQPCHSLPKRRLAAAAQYHLSHTLTHSDLSDEVSAAHTESEVYGQAAVAHTHTHYPPHAHSSSQPASPAPFSSGRHRSGGGGGRHTYLDTNIDGGDTETASPTRPTPRKRGRKPATSALAELGALAKAHAHTHTGARALTQALPPVQANTHTYGYAQYGGGYGYETHTNPATHTYSPQTHTTYGYEPDDTHTQETHTHTTETQGDKDGELSPHNPPLPPPGPPKGTWTTQEETRETHEEMGDAHPDVSFPLPTLPPLPLPLPGAQDDPAFPPPSPNPFPANHPFPPYTHHHLLGGGSPMFNPMSPNHFPSNNGNAYNGNGYFDVSPMAGQPGGGMFGRHGDMGMFSMPPPALTHTSSPTGLRPTTTLLTPTAQSVTHTPPTTHTALPPDTPNSNAQKRSAETQLTPALAAVSLTPDAKKRLKIESETNLPPQPPAPLPPLPPSLTGSLLATPLGSGPPAFAGLVGTQSAGVSGGVSGGARAQNTSLSVDSAASTTARTLRTLTDAHTTSPPVSSVSSVSPASSPGSFATHTHTTQTPPTTATGVTTATVSPSPHARACVTPDVQIRAAQLAAAALEAAKSMGRFVSSTGGAGGVGGGVGGGSVPPSPQLGGIMAPATALGVSIFRHPAFGRS